MMHRIFALYILFIFTLPILLCGDDWLFLLVGNIDHCPMLGCDFQRHYLPQGELLLQGSSSIQTGFFYPPLLAVLLWPLASIDVDTALSFWYCLQVVCIFSLGGLAYYVQRKGHWIFALMFPFISLAILHNVKWGQVSVLLNVLLIVGLLRKKHIGGLLIGICTALKGYPVLFLGYAVLKKDWKMLVAGIASAFVFGILIPMLVLGWEHTLMFYENMIQMSSWVSANAAGGGGQALGPSLTRYFVDASMFVGATFSTEPLILALPTFLVPILWLSIVVLCGRIVVSRWHTLDDIEQISCVLLGLTLLLPPSWVHYLSFLPFVHWVLFYRYCGPSKYIVTLSIVLSTLPILGVLVGPEMYFYWAAWGFGTISVTLTIIGIILANHKDYSHIHQP
jgi:hypothetical protein